MVHYCQATMVLPSVELTTESDYDKNSISSRRATAGGSRNKRDGSSPARQPPPGAYLQRSLLHLLLSPEDLLAIAEPQRTPVSEQPVRLVLCTYLVRHRPPREYRRANSSRKNGENFYRCLGAAPSAIRCLNRRRVRQGLYAPRL
ncbi:hypothetical protein PMIN06_012562 [Paraphaeosphaeria minitans]